MKVTVHKSLFVFLGICLSFKATAYAEECLVEDPFCLDSTLSFFTDRLPVYTVKFIPAGELPIRVSTLSTKAIKYLPKQLKQLKEGTSVLAENIPQKSIVRFVSQEEMEYCDEQRRICWFKTLTLGDGYIFVENWQGQILRYKDTLGLAKFFWAEAAQL